MLTSISAFSVSYGFDQSMLLGASLGVFLSLFILALNYQNASRGQTSNWWIFYLASEGMLLFLLYVSFAPDRHGNIPELRLQAMEVTVGIMSFAAINLIRSQLHSFSIMSQCARHALTLVGILALLSALLKIVDVDNESVAVSVVIAVSLVFANYLLNFGLGSPPLLDIRASSWADIFNFIFFLPLLIIGFSLSSSENWAANIHEFEFILSVLLFLSGITLVCRFAAGMQSQNGSVNKEETMVFTGRTLENHVMSLASHELRNELGMMNTAISELARHKHIDPRIAHCQTQLVNVYLQMKRVVESFLLAERLESNKSGIIYSLVEPRRLVSEAIYTVKRSGHQGAIHLDDKALPEQSRLDGDVFKVVLINVLHNAVKYSGTKSEMFIRGSYTNKILKISVIDNGIGMSRMALSQLGQRHFSARPGSEGAGLGLYLVRMILNAHGGGLRISSTPGRGTNVEFWLEAQ